MPANEDDIFRNSLWNFVNWNSIWPLPHVILAYHTYMYTRNWMSVLCFYYLVKVVQLLLFSILSFEYEHFFSELTDTEEKTRSLYSVARNFNPDERSTSCVIDFNGVFIGGTIQTVLGIMLGMVHSYLCAPSIHDVSNFHPVTFWKSPATKHDKKFTEAKRFVDETFGTHNIGFKYGLWPVHQIFGLKIPNENKIRESSAKQNVRMNSEKSASDGNYGKGEKQLRLGELEMRQIYRRWKFRKVFWVRWLQLTLLGTPALLFYTANMVSGSVFRSGSILYGFVTCSLLLCYKEYNQRIYLEHLVGAYERKENELSSENGRSDPEEGIRDTRSGGRDDRTAYFEIVDYDSKSTSFEGDLIVRKNRLRAMNLILLIFNHDMDMTFNSYDVIYTVWISTCVMLIVFQSVPILTSFYRVIISAVFIAVASFVFAYLHDTAKPKSSS